MTPLLLCLGISFGFTRFVCLILTCSYKGLFPVGVRSIGISLRLSTSKLLHHAGYKLPLCSILAHLFCTAVLHSLNACLFTTSPLDFSPRHCSAVLLAKIGTSLQAPLPAQTVSFRSTFPFSFSYSGDAQLLVQGFPWRTGL